VLDLELKINDVSIVLGEQANWDALYQSHDYSNIFDDRLRLAKIRRLGWLGTRMNRINKGDIIYRIAHCRIEILGEFYLLPIDAMSPFGFSDTRVEIYELNKIVWKINIISINDKSRKQQWPGRAEVLANTFNELCSKKHGLPEIVKLTDTSKQKYDYADIWPDDNSNIKSTIFSQKVLSQKVFIIMWELLRSKSL
jgi:hypothetical protein